MSFGSSVVVHTCNPSLWKTAVGGKEFKFSLSDKGNFRSAWTIPSDPDSTKQQNKANKQNPKGMPIAGGRIFSLLVIGKSRKESEKCFIV